MASGLGSSRTPKKQISPIIRTRAQKSSAIAKEAKASKHRQDDEGKDDFTKDAASETEASSSSEDEYVAADDHPVTKPFARFVAGGDARESQRHMPKLVRFSGENTTIKISKWLKLYDVASINCPDTKTKISMMISYLDGEALNFFADEIASNAKTITWDQVVHLFEERFGEEVVSPVVAANKRRLHRGESVQAYYEACMSLLRQTKIDDKDKVAILTDGMPNNYKNTLIGARPSTPLQWRSIAIGLEEANKYSFKAQMMTNQNTNQGAVAFAALSKEKPPKPCAICQRFNKIEWHWHSQCPNRNSSQVPLNPNSTHPAAFLASDEINPLNETCDQCPH